MNNIIRGHSDGVSLLLGDENDDDEYYYYTTYVSKNKEILL
jgi:hypothetical protein